MKKHTSESALIAKINKALPEARATPYREFAERDVVGIWFRGSESYAGDIPIYDCYNAAQEIHPTLEKMLNDAGWYAEPYDSGTLIAYPA